MRHGQESTDLQPASRISRRQSDHLPQGPDAIANGDVSWVIETSESLAAGSWTPQVTQAVRDPAITISYTLTPNSPVTNFIRLRVTKAP